MAGGHDTFTPEQRAGSQGVCERDVTSAEAAPLPRR